MDFYLWSTKLRPKASQISLHNQEKKSDQEVVELNIFYHLYHQVDTWARFNDYSSHAHALKCKSGSACQRSCKQQNNIHITGTWLEHVPVSVSHSILHSVAFHWSDHGFTSLVTTATCAVLCLYSSSRKLESWSDFPRGGREKALYPLL